jgi:hypothetical protein
MVGYRGQDGLEVRHRRRKGGNELPNAQVLCGRCCIGTSSRRAAATSPPPFSQDTEGTALRRAGWQCECVRSGCH